MGNLRADLTDGSAQLDCAEPHVLIEGFENLTHWKTRKPIKAILNYDKKADGNSRVKVIFNKDEIDPMLFSFSSTKLSVTDWSDYNFLEFDVYVELDLSLFDISITFNNEYGRGYNVRGGVD